MKDQNVTAWLDKKSHPLRKEIEALRDIMLNTKVRLTENVKWNGPNYCFNGEDRFTMMIQHPEQVRIIFHRGAKKIRQPEEKLIADPSGILEWKGNDRAVATFKTTGDIVRYKSVLRAIVEAWIKASS